MNKVFQTREEWLNAFIAASKAEFFVAGVELPKNVRASIGFTSVGLRGSRIGECWSDDASADGTFEIFIVPGIDDASRIAGILTHELVHAAVGLAAGHRGPFRKIAIALGLVGKMTATTEGEIWHKWADPILEKLGPLPHAKLTGSTSGRKKQNTRLLKCECDKCGFVFRASAKWAFSSDELRCPDPSCDGSVFPTV